MSNLYPLLRPPRPAAPRRRRALAGSFAGALAALSLAAALLVPSSAAAAPPRQDPPQKPSVVAGMGVYMENCAPCHGVTGLGDGPTAPALDFPPANFADPEPAKTRTLTDMVATITDGRMDKLMPPWGARLSKEEIWDVAAYIQNLSVSPATLEAAAAAYAENCAECHGPQGDGAGVDFSQPAALTGDSLQTLFDRLRPAAGDHAPLADLPDETLWQSLIAVRNFGLELPVLDGVLRGQVTNGTTGQTGAGIALTLYALSPGGDPLQTFTAVSDADGAFSFNNLNRDHSLSYALEGAYLDISYFSAGPVVFVPGEREATLNLSVFETTPDPSAVYQSNLHRIMSFGAGWMSIADVYIFGNRGDRSFVGQPGEDGLPETVKIALPAEATNISFRNNTVRQIEDGSGTYLDSQPIPPGADVYTLFVTYDIPIEGKTKTVETPLFYSIQSVNVLATDQGQTIESPHLTLAGIESIQGNDYMRLTGANLSPQDTFVMTFDRLDEIQIVVEDAAGEPATVKTAAAGVDQTILRWAIIGLGALVTAAGVTVAARQKPDALPQASLPQEKTRLLTLLGELETLRQDEELDAPTYERLKQTYRTQLKHVLAQLHD